ncbi:hypothetical protein ACQ4PT_054888 [Festuca glaucescens]
MDPFHLTEVWVRVYGCCYKERCDYLSLFAVGSLIGKTKEVDMEFTTSHFAVRLKAEVTCKEYIPTTTVDHVYDGEGYGLTFKVEDVQEYEKTDVVIDEVNLEDESKQSQNKGSDETKGSDLNSASGSANTANASKSDPPIPNNVMNKQAQSLSLSIMVGSVSLSWPCTKSEDRKYTLMPRRLWSDNDDEDDSFTLSLPCSNNISTTPDGHLQLSAITPDPHVSVVAEHEAPSHDNFPFEHTEPHSPDVSNVSEGHHGTVGTGVFLGGRFSMKDVVKFGGIPPPSKDLQSSERISHQHNADATQMARAQQLAQAKNSAPLSEKKKDDIVLHNDTLEHAQDLASDLHDEDHFSTEERAPIREKKILKVYKRKVKVAPKVVRRSVRLSKKIGG